VGSQSVPVPAGTFHEFKVDLTSADGGSGKATVWIVKDPASSQDVSGSGVNGSSDDNF
jgi:hypothetical protein